MAIQVSRSAQHGERRSHVGAECTRLRRSQGAGLLLAESVVGARNALHSKAPRLLTMLLAEDIVKASELKTEKVGSDSLSRCRCCVPILGSQWRIVCHANTTDRLQGARASDLLLWSAGAEHAVV